MSDRFSLCKGYYVGNKFHPNTETETMTCCLNTCKDIVQTCLNSCLVNYGPEGKTPNFKIYTKCKNNCARMIMSCENTCALSSPGIWRGNSPILDCITSKGCGKYPNYDKDCIKNNKDELIRCCNHNCLPSKEMSCTNHCKVKYDDLVGESVDPLLVLYDKSPDITSSLYKGKKLVSMGDNSWKWYLVTSCLVLVSFIIWMKMN